MKQKPSNNTFRDDKHHDVTVVEAGRVMTDTVDRARPVGKTKRKRVSPGKREIVVISDIRPGPASPTQKAAWRRFFRRLITEVKG